MIETGPFTIVGISTITTNADGRSASDIGALWQKFYSEEVMNKVPHKLSSDIYAVYTDYETNYTGNYTIILGLRSTASVAPEGLIIRKFTGGRFVRFIAKGDMPASLIGTWQQIWADDEHLSRRYDYDFEVYGDKSNAGADSEIDIYVSVI